MTRAGGSSSGRQRVAELPLEEGQVRRRPPRGGGIVAAGRRLSTLQIVLLLLRVVLTRGGRLTTGGEAGARESVEFPGGQDVDHQSPEFEAHHLLLGQQPGSVAGPRGTGGQVLL